MSIDSCDVKRNSPALSVKAEIESHSFLYSDVGKIWGSLTLFSKPLSKPSSLMIDFVVVVDTSASMKLDGKLAFIQATVDYMLTRLDSNQTLTLIAFNHEVTLLTELMPCTPENKEHIHDIIGNLEASGSTNISEALMTGVQVLQNRENSRKRISTLMLFTDGLSNEGLHPDETLKSLDKLCIPTGCVFNTIGFGEDHDSRLLHAIALKAQGVYYYVETADDIPSFIAECVAGILSASIHNVRITLTCCDGARLVTLATPLAITEQKVAKEYSVALELMYGDEMKSVLFRLSLRAMSQPMNAHRLLNIKVEYIDVATGNAELYTSHLDIVRPAMPLIDRMPLVLDQQINRFFVATAITEAIELAKKSSFTEAQQKLMEMIEKVEQSPSGREPYCVDLTRDLQDCVCGMSDPRAFQTGCHCAHALASMYFMERSAGLKERLRRRGQFSVIRDVGYGYVTHAQEEEAQYARKRVEHFVSAYADTSSGHTNNNNRHCLGSSQLSCTVDVNG